MKTVRLSPPSELAMPIGETMFTQRAIPRLDASLPISDEALKIVLDAATKAPNGGNAQPLRFLIVRGRQKIAQFGKLYHEAWWAKRKDQFGWTVDQKVPHDSPYRMAAILASELGTAPVVILAFTKEGAAGAASSVFPGVQNLLLAARALGIGSVLTRLHPSVMSRVREMFAVPDDAEFHCCIPLGYPRGNFGPTSRFETAATTYWNRWGTSPPWAE
jgi:nitroreductase